MDILKRYSKSLSACHFQCQGSQETQEIVVIRQSISAALTVHKCFRRHEFDPVLTASLLL
ncbi:hypothetical protein SY86_12705 [Erwinia tracheiphila]|uniref:Uncharacterized protein n=1 Tax=Erwinia tracheiphila TaxID=65700 RepID=A0A0M2K9M5_9GAMM|nr:hypothetical protein AV903_16190 [Erwinia tracheiphila]KKF36090.1 hypothetical protein SY86_12705 [Erwinia tracheiphila]